MILAAISPPTSYSQCITSFLLAPVPSSATVLRLSLYLCRMRGMPGEALSGILGACTFTCYTSPSTTTHSLTPPSLLPYTHTYAAIYASALL